MRASRVLVLLRRLRAGLARLDARLPIGAKLAPPILLASVLSITTLAWYTYRGEVERIEETFQEEALHTARSIEGAALVAQELPGGEANVPEAIDREIHATIVAHPGVLLIDVLAVAGGAPVIVESSDHARIGSPEALERYADEDLEDVPLTGQSVGEERVGDRRALEVHLPLEASARSGWLVVLYLSTAERDQALASLFRNIAFGGGLAAVIMPTVVFGSLRFFAEARKRRLLAATARMQAGDYTARVEGVFVAEPRDEILLISSRFNAMADAIDSLHQEVTEQARTDALTGLHNRRYAMEALERELHQARRSGEPLSVIVVDLDKLKELNDTWGHLAGDGALRLVAGTLGKTLRAGDISSRFGGDEFLLILPACDGEVLASVLGRIRADMQDVGWQHDTMPGPWRITLSGGGATMRLGDTVDSLIRRADTALLEAKRAGRNQIRLAA